MAGGDKDTYVAEMISGAQRVLKDSGKPEFASQVYELFTKRHTGSTVSLGMGEFEMNLARARAADLKRIEGDPNARRLEVEDAMIVTLRKNGIELPPAFLTVGGTFKPKYPPQSK